MSDLVIGNNVYERVDKLVGTRVALALGCLSRVDLKPLFHVVAAAMESRNGDIALIFKNGFLAEAIQKIMAQADIAFDIASLMIVKKGDKDKRIENYDEYREPIIEDLKWSDFSVTYDLVAFFLASTPILDKVLTNFSMEAAEMEAE